MGHKPFARAAAAGAVLTLLLLVAAPAAAQASTEAPWWNVDRHLGPVWTELAPVCADLRDDLREDGHIGNDTNEPKENIFEDDPLYHSPECAQIRDEVEDDVWGDDKPIVHECQTVRGLDNCVVTGHYACDFALYAASGIVYFCWGGLFPDN